MTGIYDTINGVNCLIILTTAPNDSVAPIHDRMPLLLRTSCDGQLGFDDLA